MEKKGVFTRILAIAGTVLVWLPLLAPVLFTLIRLARGGSFMLDYLMPAELFPLVVAGWALLVWAALRVHKRRGLVLGGIGAAVAALVLGAVIARVTGLATGEIEPVGWPWALVLAMLVGYVLAVVETGVAGALLLVDLFRRVPAR